MTGLGNIWAPSRDPLELSGLPSSSIVVQAVTASITYTVPANKLLLIHSLAMSGGGGSNTALKFDSVKMIEVATNVSINMVDAGRVHRPLSGENTVLLGSNEAASTTDLQEIHVPAPSSVNYVIVDRPYLLFPVAAGTVISSDNNSGTCRFWGTLRDA